MPAPRKTMKDHKASGAVERNPKRFADRADDPVPKASIGRAPRHLSAPEQKVWREIVSQAPEGVLGTCDMLAVEVAVKMIIRMRTSPDMKASEFSSIINILGRLGLTPGDRTRLNIKLPPPKEEKVEDEWDGL